jgi:hypothetical protein
MSCGSAESFEQRSHPTAEVEDATGMCEGERIQQALAEWEHQRAPQIAVALSVDGIARSKVGYTALLGGSDPEAGSYPVGVVVIGDDAISVDNLTIAEAGIAQLLDVLLVDFRKNKRDLSRIAAQRPAAGAHHFETLKGDRPEKRVVSGKPAELLAMLLQSVVSRVDRGNGDRQKLSLGATQRRIPEH